MDEINKKYYRLLETLPEGDPRRTKLACLMYTMRKVARGDASGVPLLAYQAAPIYPLLEPRFDPWCGSVANARIRTLGVHTGMEEKIFYIGSRKPFTLGNLTQDSDVDVFRHIHFGSYAIRYFVSDDCFGVEEVHCSNSRKQICTRFLPNNTAMLFSDCTCFFERMKLGGYPGQRFSEEAHQKLDFT